MGKIFLIPGLGADSRVYHNIELPGSDVVLVDWIAPEKKDNLSSYAQKLINQYCIVDGSIVIGNSLGGMIAVEIANVLRIQKVILISSAKVIDELPPLVGLIRHIPIYKILPSKTLNFMGMFVRFVFDKMDQYGKWLFEDMLKKSSPTFSRWAIEAVANWDNKVIPANLYHLTGDKDKTFPYKRIKGATIVKGGTHVMIYDRADEINAYLHKVLAR